MKVAPFRHIGGAVIADHGPLSLAAAEASKRFYAEEASAYGQVGALRFARLCVARRDALGEAIAEASRWRRAAGWADPNQAD
jgi:hypothetical protein